MKSGKPTVRPSSTSRKSRKLTRATAAVFEQMEPRRLMSGTLTIAPNSGNDQIVLDVAANGGIIKTVNGVQTTYSPGQWTDVLVDSFQNGEPLTIRATTVPVHISA